MSLFPCPECQNQISEGAQACPKCGWVVDKERLYAIRRATQEALRKNQEAQKQKTEEYKKETKKGFKFIILALGVLLVATVVATLLSPKEERPKTSVATQTQRKERTSEVVYNDAWDGSVKQVKEWVKTNTRDPSSVQFLEWSKVTIVDGAFIVRAKYRAKNGYGGYTVETTVFKLDSSGKVTGAQVIESF